MSVADNIGDAVITFIIDVVRAPFLAAKEARRRQRDQDRSDQIQLAAAAAKTALPRHATAFASDLLDRLRPRPSDLDYRLLVAAQDLYDMEFTAAPEPPDTTAIEHARYLDQLARHTTKVSNPHTLRVFTETVQEALEHFLDALPEAAFSEDQTTFSVPFADTSDIGSTIEEITQLFSSIKARDLALFNQLREQLDYNRHYFSGVEFTPHAALPYVTNYKPAKLKRPSEDTDPNVAWRYLQNTPLVDLFNVSIPFDITPHRFDHHHIVGGSGHGKTQALQYLIAHDLERVAKGECSIVVIDSQNQLIPNIAGLNIFAPGQPLDGKLVLIDPHDVEYPVCLSLFSMGLDRLSKHSRLDQERLLNSVCELLSFTLGGLLSQDMTAKQGTLFNFVMRAMLEIPDATIMTFLELLQKGGYEKYKPYIDALPKIPRLFFEGEFNGPEFSGTRQEVLRRLWGILENEAFTRMFSQPENKLDLFTELQAGKVILINTAKDLLKESGCQVFGKFFVAMLAQAAQERATVKDNLSTYVYLDEAHEYLDANAAVILEQARKYKIGLVVAHQYLGQLSAPLQASLSANTAIKFAGGLSADDCRRMAPMLRCDPKFIEKQPELSFAAFVRGNTASAVSLNFPGGHLEKMPRMSAHDSEVIRDRMRARYARPLDDVVTATPAITRPAELSDPDNPEY